MWAANLLHGGIKMINKKLTRKSQVIHFHFKNSDIYYNPGFSEPNMGLYAKRKLDIVDYIVMSPGINIKKTNIKKILKKNKKKIITDIDLF